MAALAAFQKLTSLVAQRGCSHFIDLLMRDIISEAYSPSGAAALAVVLISYTCKGAAAIQKLTPLVAWRRWW